MIILITEVFLYKNLFSCRYSNFQHCGKVLGLELVPEAVKDAKANAELNEIENSEFYTGKAEDILPSVLARATGDDVIAIVDPPRAGLREYPTETLHSRSVNQGLKHCYCRELLFQQRALLFEEDNCQHSDITSISSDKTRSVHYDRVK